MSETDSTKVVGLDFTVKDHSAEPAGRMKRSFEGVSRAIEHTTHSLHQLGHHTAVSALGAMGLGLGFHAIAEKAKEANLEIEDSTKKLAGMKYAFGHWHTGASAQDRWNASMEEGREIVERLEESEGKLKMGRSALAGIFKSTTAIAEKHGLTLDQQLDLTEKLGAVERVLGVNAEFAGMQVARMAMSGNLRGFDDFSKSMRFAIGDMKQFAKLSESERFKRVQRAMGDLVPAAEAMGNNLAGAMFDMREAIEEVTRDLTGPLFKEVTKEFGRWAKHMTELREDGKSFATTVGEKLVTAFGYLKSVTGFLADNWKSIAIILGANKALGMLGGLGGLHAGAAATGHGGGVVGGAVGSMHVTATSVVVNSAAAGAAVGHHAGEAIATSLRPSMGNTISHLAGLAGKTLMVTEGLTALYLSAQGFASWMDARQTEHLNTQRGATRTIDALTAGAKAMSSALNERAVTETFQHLQNAFGAYGLKPGQNLSAKAIAEELRAMAPETAAQQIGMYGIRGASARSVQGAGFIDDASVRIANLLNGFAQKLLEANPELGKSDAHIKGKGDIKISVQHLEITQDFKQADPDRIFHRIPNDIAEMVLAPHGSNIPLIPE